MKEITIKCRTLMVGDWCCDEHEFPMQITNVGDDYAYATFEGNEGDPWEFDDKDNQPKPITIAKVLLVNNGWKEYGYLDPAYSCSFCSIDREGYNLEWKNEYLFITRINSGEIPDMLSSVKYVHQLQQILRLYGLNALADNFKV